MNGATMKDELTQKSQLKEHSKFEDDIRDAKMKRLEHVIKLHTENGVLTLSTSIIQERFGFGSSVVNKMCKRLGIKSQKTSSDFIYGDPTSTHGLYQP